MILLRSRVTVLMIIMLRLSTFPQWLSASAFPAWLRAKQSRCARNHRPGLRYQMQRRGALERAVHPAEEPTDAERHEGGGMGLGLDPVAKPSVEIACGL